jgi:GTP-binding protein
MGVAGAGRFAYRPTPLPGGIRPLRIPTMPGLIAIVGRPNVGKSALFNRIAGRRIAIVHDQPGVTRDRVSAEVEWQGVPFTLVDTGGIGLVRREKAEDVITRAALAQVELAIEAAHVIVLVVNVQEGITPLDREVAERLRRSGKPVLIAANKADNADVAEDSGDFAALGYEQIFPVSAIHDRGVADLMAAAMRLLPQEETAFAPAAEPGSAATPAEGQTSARLAGPLKIAVVGRPNVGKSSIINALTQSERVIVSPVPGTTRDAVDVPFEVVTEGVRSQYVLIDTAGMRKTRQVDDSIEFFSVQRTVESIQRSDLVVFVLDAEAGILEQDKKVADKITEARRACILVVNKWDLFEEKFGEQQQREAQQAPAKGARKYGPRPLKTSLNTFADWVQEKLFFLSYAPVIFTSAQTGFHLDRLLEAIRYVAAQLQQKIPTALLNRTLHDAVERRQPVSSHGARLKFFYATQVRQSPPTFLLFVNRKDLFSPQYEKYLAGELRRAFGYEGCALVLVAKPRERVVLAEKRQAPSRARPARRTRREGDRSRR